jgi:hypothetical protein
MALSAPTLEARTSLADVLAGKIHLFDSLGPKLEDFKKMFSLFDFERLLKVLRIVGK